MLRQGASGFHRSFVFHRAAQVLYRMAVLQLFLSLGFAVLPGSAMAGMANSTPWESNDKVTRFVQEMVTKHGFEQSSLQQLFAQANRKEDIIMAISRPAEKVLAWKEYQDIFLTSARVREGKVFMQTQGKYLHLANKQFGVPSSVIAAIIGVETSFGRHKGKHRVLDALSTLAFAYPPRSSFFRQELEHYLLLTREQGLDPLTLKGSYAGAMGYGQFIPSSYRHYAIDFDGDDVIDLMNSPADAIGSVANYLYQHGWSEGAVMVSQARLKGNKTAYKIPKGLKLSQTISSLKQAGVDFLYTDTESAKARLMKLKGKEGDEYWVAMNNFYVITRYNLSDLYAMAVFQLSQSLEGE